MRQLKRFFRFLLRLQGAVVVGGRFDTEHNHVEIEVRRRKNAKPRCVICNQVMGGEIREIKTSWRHLDMMMSIPTYIVGVVREGRCAKHGRRHERIPWAGCRARFTRPFDHQVARLVQVADKTAASRMFGINWRTVGRMVERVVGLHLPKDRYRGVRSICVDETSYKRGHRYITVVTCLTSGNVLWVGEGKSGDTLREFFRDFGAQRTRQLEVVAMDMSSAYHSVVTELAPQADIVIDRFHVVQGLLKAIDEVRREEVRKLPGGDKKKALKGTRFALLRNPRHLKPRDETMISDVAKTNRRLFRAWELRAEMESFWDMPDEESAREFIMKWTRSALLSRREPLRKFAKTVRQHLKGILGFFRHGGVTSGPIEGMNNKIKLIMHRAFGMRSVASLIAMIHLCCSGIHL